MERRRKRPEPPRLVTFLVTDEKRQPLWLRLVVPLTVFLIGLFVGGAIPHVDDRPWFRDAPPATASDTKR